MLTRPAPLIAAMTAWVLLVSPAAVPAIATPMPAMPDCGGAETATAATPAAATPTGVPPASLATAALHPVVDVPLPGSPTRFDYQSLDDTSGRLVIAHMGADQVIVFDTNTRQVVGVVDGVDTPTGVLAVPALHRIFAAAPGSHDVAIVDARTLKVVARAGQIGFPDGLAYAPRSQQVFVSDESGGGELVVDATTNRAVATIDIGGKAGNTHYDPITGCVLVAVQSRNQLAAIDPTTDRLVARYDLDAACQAPHGFLIDAPRRLAFVSCEENATLLVVDLRTMRVTGSHPLGQGPDVLAFDPGWRRLYVASEAGVVSVFDEVGTDLHPVGEYDAPHAHTIAVDPRTHLVYLPLQDVSGKPVLRILAAGVTREG